MRAQIRLRSLEIYAGSLLVGLGVLPQLGCSGDVLNPSGGGGAGGGSTSAGPSVTSSVAATTSSNSSSVASTSATTSTGGGTGGCVNPTPVLVNGQDTGIDSCAGGQLRRRAALECPTNFPDTNPCCGGCPDGTICNDQGEIACLCVDACTNDSECGANELCLCGDPAGICVPAGCQAPSDCAPGQECTTWDTTQGCLYYAFECTTNADTCGGDLDCSGANEFCSVMPDGHRECAPGGCAIGRPFLVHDVARVADVEARSDWLVEITPSIDLGTLPASLRAEVAAGWREIAQMEHASVAAFARFSLQLMALGAGPDLVNDAARAMQDEARHAQLAFGLASRFGNAPCGPAELPLDGAMDAGLLAGGALDWRSVLVLTLREGVVGETVAALEAAELSNGDASASAANPQLPEIAAVLAEVASDEQRHAELAWRFVDYALQKYGAEAASLVRSEMALLREEQRFSAAGQGVQATADERRLESFGLLSPARRASLRAQAVSRLVLPCLEALVADRSRLAA